MACCYRPLPFSVELKKFIVEYYDTGMPKLFASEVVIHDLETGESIPKRIEVEPPCQLQRHRDLPVQLRRWRLQSAPECRPVHRRGSHSACKAKLVAAPRSGHRTTAIPCKP